MSKTCNSFVCEVYTTDGALHIIRYASMKGYVEFMQIYDLEGNRVLEFTQKNIIYTRIVGPIFERNEWMNYVKDRIKEHEPAIKTKMLKVIIHDAINNVSEMVVVEHNQN